MISFKVHGKPQQRGSKRAMPNRAGGRPLMVDDNPKSKPWMAAVASAAAEAMDNAPLLAGPLEVRAVFWIKRPKNHFGAGKKATIIKASAPKFHSARPDVDKMIRAIGDAMTGVVYRDDSQIAQICATKMYVDSSEGVEVWVSEL